MNTDKKTLTVRIITFALILVAIVILMRVVVRATKAAGTYDTFAQCLVSKGVKFYGAFWCPHCQEQEKWLDASRQKLEREGLYKECSTADTRGQTELCKTAKIESYPTWNFANGITYKSDVAPAICDITPGKPGEESVCAQSTSTFFKRWIFPNGGPVIASDTEPTYTSGTWTFSPSSQIRGEATVDRLSLISGCPLPGAAAANATE